MFGNLKFNKRRFFALPQANRKKTDIAILGSGIAGLTAAWKLGREGHKDVLMIDGPQPYGNAAGGHFGQLAFPTGAHYLPLPSPESVHVCEILSEHRRFFHEVERLRALRGADGRREFVFPTIESSSDLQWQALDRIARARRFARCRCMWRRGWSNRLPTMASTRSGTCPCTRHGWRPIS